VLGTPTCQEAALAATLLHMPAALHACHLTPPAACAHASAPAGTFITKNLIPATLGNIIGGVGFVGIAYAMAFGSPGHTSEWQGWGLCHGARGVMH